MNMRVLDSNNERDIPEGMLAIARRTIFYLATHFHIDLRAAVIKGNYRCDPAKKVNFTMSIYQPATPVMGIQICIKNNSKESTSSFGSVEDVHTKNTILPQSLVSKIIRNLDDGLRSAITEVWLPYARSHFLERMESQKEYDLLVPFNENINILKEQILEGNLPRK